MKLYVNDERRSVGKHMCRRVKRQFSTEKYYKIMFFILSFVDVAIDGKARVKESRKVHT